MLLELEKPRIIRRVTRSYGGGTPGVTDHADLTNVTTNQHHLSEKSASYIIRINGSSYEAVNGTTGAIDYSGTNFVLMINAVINSLTNGGLIFLKQGTYTVTYEGGVADPDFGASTDNYGIYVNQDDITIMGEGNSTILKLGDNENNTCDVIFVENGRTRVKIMNLAIDGNKANNASGGDGIRFLNVTYCQADNLYIKDTKGSNIHIMRRAGLFEENQSIVSHCVLDSADDYGVGLYFARNNTVSDNQFISQDGVRGAIDLNNSYNNILSNNAFYNCTPTGIYLSNSYDNVIEGNHIDTTGYGIAIYTNSSRNLVVGNVIREATYYGIYLLTGATSNTITGNEIYHSKYGGLLLNVSCILNTIGGNIIVDNDRLDTASYDGIRLIAGCNNNIITGNILYWNDRYQMSIESNNNVISENYVSGSGAVGTINNTGTGNKYHLNIGYVTDNSGSSSIDNGSTSKVVAHGLNVTPSAEHITIIGKENPTNSVGTIWVDTIGAANFTVNVENDPGASNWDFGWKVIVL